jgi:hypothetical protein
LNEKHDHACHDGGETPTEKAVVAPGQSTFEHRALTALRTHLRVTCHYVERHLNQQRTKTRTTQEDHKDLDTVVVPPPSSPPNHSVAAEALSEAVAQWHQWQQQQTTTTTKDTKRQNKSNSRIITATTNAVIPNDENGGDTLTNNASCYYFPTKTPSDTLLFRLIVILQLCLERIISLRNASSGGTNGTNPTSNHLRRLQQQPTASFASFIPWSMGDVWTTTTVAGVLVSMAAVLPWSPRSTSNRHYHHPQSRYKGMDMFFMAATGIASVVSMYGIRRIGISWWFSRKICHSIRALEHWNTRWMEYLLHEHPQESSSFTSLVLQPPLWQHQRQIVSTNHSPSSSSSSTREEQSFLHRSPQSPTNNRIQCYQVSDRNYKSHVKEKRIDVRTDSSHLFSHICTFQKQIVGVAVNRR